MDFTNYDLAANKFYLTLYIKSSTINSWDLYISYFDRFCQSTNDIIKLNTLTKRNKWSYRENFKEVLLHKEKVIIVTDPQLRVVYATHNMEGTNGFNPEEVIGKDPKIFQGEDTCKATTKSIGLAIKNKAPFEAVLLNYRKGGSAYKCWIKGEPI